jgi:tetratricopeptide (TPR) repeat protein
MRRLVFVAVVCLAMPAVTLAQGGQTRAVRPAAPAPAKNDKLAQAYEQFLRGHHLEDSDDIPGAIEAYKKAIELDPLAAEVPAELAALYLRQNRTDEAIATAEQALKVEPANAEANRVLGMIYASRLDAGARGGRQSQAAASPQDRQKAIQYLEAATAHPLGEADPTARATLARLYLSVQAYDKAIAVLVDLVKQQPGWQEGPALLTQAYAAAGRVNDAIALLDSQATDNPELLPTLANFYERMQRWQDAANTYSRAIDSFPRNIELRKSYGSALLNAGGRNNIAAARDTLMEVVAASPSDTRALYLLSQADRRFGDLDGAEAAARRLIAAQQSSPWGYYALAETLEERRDYDAVVDVLTPAVAIFHAMPGDHSLELGMLLPHLGFAQQVRGEYEKATATFNEAHRLSPKDGTITAYLIEANIAAKKYGAAAELARQARADNPTDLRLARLEAQALTQDGKIDQGLAVMEDAVKTHADDPTAYVALAQLYSESSRGPQAVKVLQDAQAKFPASNAITFQLGAVYDKQKKFTDAEAAFQQVLTRDPENAAALNYLGYMLADRGERLDESVGYLKKALEIEPDNGSYLDSIGWAYFKQNKLDLAEANLRRAAEQLKTNSVIQSHFGEVLFKVGRYDQAIEAWNRALTGDGDEIDRAGLDKKIRTAKQKIKK